MDIRKIIKKTGTPVYIYDEQTIIDCYRNILDAIPYFDKRLHYAVMCNNNPEILKIIQRMGGSVQINSLHEMEIVKQAGFSADHISFTSTGLDENSLQILCNEDVHINLDSVEEVEKYCRISPGGRFGIRIKMLEDIELPEEHTNSPKDSDIGICSDDFEKVKIIASRKGCIINEVHGYLASNILVSEPFILSSNYILESAIQFPDLEKVNFGSGFGIPSKPDERAFDFKRIGLHYSQLTRQLSEKLNSEIHLKIEPGRSILGPAGTLYARVTNVKQLKGKKQIAIDAGFGEFARPNLYNAWHDIQALGKTGKEEIYDIRANTVLQSDFLGRDRLLPEIKENDILALKNTGAYGFVMVSGFPGKKLPAQLLIRLDRTIQVL